MLINLPFYPILEEYMNFIDEDDSERWNMRNMYVVFNVKLKPSIPFMRIIWFNLKPDLSETVIDNYMCGVGQVYYQIFSAYCLKKTS